MKLYSYEFSIVFLSLFSIVSGFYAHSLFILFFHQKVIWITLRRLNVYSIEEATEKI